MMVMIRQSEIMSKLAQLAGPLAKSSCGWELAKNGALIFGSWLIQSIQFFLALVGKPFVHRGKFLASFCVIKLYFRATWSQGFSG